jgi:hypothetical protein
VSNPNKLIREQAADFGNMAEVKLGDYDYVIVPQRIGYLRSQLGVVLKGVIDQDLSSDNIVDLLGEKLYGAMRVFIPDIMPEWEFHGYATKEAMDEDKYEPQYDKSPSPTQVRRALTAASEVNEIDLLRHLGKLIGPDLIRSWLAGAMADSMEASLSKSQPTNGDSPGTSSLTSVPTSG